ncbi:MAG: hypothetical protein H7A05_06110 [Pseudomonadales bacterium]|nr:hypothetical protein [Pseudomonadales bacterium]MCP5344176.1 hypothetical protein [Pseudomonadales bacterium]
MNDHPNPRSFDPILCDVEAAKVLDSTSASLKQSRYTGMLFGRPAPKFIKMGRSAKYKLSTLLAFRDQFIEFQNTAEANQAKGVK